MNFKYFPTYFCCKGVSFNYMITHLTHLTFVSLFLSCILYFVAQIRKPCYRKTRDWTFEVYLLMGEPSLWFLLIEWLKMIFARSCACFLNFLSNGEGLDYFPQRNILPRLSKITVTCPKCRVNFNFPKVRKMTEFWTDQSQQNG